MRYRDKNGRFTSDPAAAVSFASVEERFFSKVRELPNGCLQWTGNVDRKGYGYFWLNGKDVRVHRYAWELEFGPIPKGLEIDHLCRNPGCVNTDHMQLVTNRENVRRGGRRGHPWEPDMELNL
jgi:hypothetical protein